MLFEMFAEGVCDECGLARKGVELFHRGRRAFLCWEHFRLAAPVLHKMQPAVIRETVIRCGCWTQCCCHCSCTRYTRAESICHSSSYGRGRSIGISESESETEGTSWSSSVSRGGGHGHGETRGISEGRTQSES
jgi:hypothetical protein